MVLLVTFLFSISALSAADINENSTTNEVTDNFVDTPAKSYTNIESNSIKNMVSNEYETITNDISPDDYIITKTSTNSMTKSSDTNESSEELEKPEVIIQTDSITAYANQLITIKANVTNQNGELLNSAKTAIKLNGKTIGQPRVTNGTISFDYELPKWHAKEYNMTIIVGETSKTSTTSINSSLLILRHDVIIEFGDYNVSSADKITFKANVSYENGTLVNATKAVFKINGKTVGSTVVKDGVASVDFVVPAKANTYDLVLKIGETTISSYNESTVKLIINKRTPTIKTDSLFFAQSGKSVTLKAQLTDVGYANASGKIGFKVNGKTIATVQMVNSTAEYTYDVSKLKLGSHVVSIVYGGSGALNEIRGNTTLRVQSEPVSTYTYDQLLAKAVVIRQFIRDNNRLPNFAIMGDNEVKMPDFLYMLAQMLAYNDSFHVGGFSKPSSSLATSSYTDLLYTSDYVPLAKVIVDSYIANGTAPTKIKAKSGYTLSFTDTVYAFVRAIAYLSENDMLPNYVGIDQISGSYDDTSSSSSSGGSSSGSSSSSGSATNNQAPAGFGEYLAQAKNAYVNSTQLVNAVKKATAGVTSLYNQAVAIFNYVNDNTDYLFYLDTRYGALQTLSQGYGNCVDQSHVLLGMYRTANIPARYCHATCYFTSGLVVGHVWVEVYVNGQWYKCDTTSNRNSFNVINNWYKSSSVKRYATLPF